MKAKNPRLQRIVPSDATRNHRTKMLFLMMCFVSLANLALVLSTAGKAQSSRSPGPGFEKEFAASYQDVLQALNEILEDQTIHGTQLSAEISNLMGATPVKSTPFFEPWKESGKAFYKIRKETTAPAHFAGSSDQGTIAVRYVVTNVSPGRTRLRIEAIYFDTAHGAVHLSDGTVEAAECKAFEDRLQAIQTAQSKKAGAQDLHLSADQRKQNHARQREEEMKRLAAIDATVHDLEQRVNTLRHEVEKRVKAPGAKLRAGPYRSAASVQDVPASTIVAILVASPHWYVVQTPGGRRGWIPQDQLENLP
jgi:hypothetical protein